MNPPTAESPLELPCDECGGDGGFEAGCRECQGRGQVALTGCPFAQVPADVWRAIDGWRRSKDRQGWPVAGGWLEQSAIFLEAVDLIGHEDARYGKEV